MCRFFESKNSEKFLADIEKKNENEGMGNIEIPHTKIKLITIQFVPNATMFFPLRILPDITQTPGRTLLLKTKPTNSGRTPEFIVMNVIPTFCPPLSYPMVLRKTKCSFFAECKR
jgi:hypothetical protein